MCAFILSHYIQSKGQNISKTSWMVHIPKLSVRISVLTFPLIAGTMRFISKCHCDRDNVSISLNVVYLHPFVFFLFFPLLLIFRFFNFNFQTDSCYSSHQYVMKMVSETVQTCLRKVILMNIKFA